MKNNALKTKTTKKPHLALLIVLTIVGLLTGMALVIGVSSWRARGQYSAVEITFISPQQAVLFWKTSQPVQGYAQWGETRHLRGNRLEQTSSEAGQVHAVMLEDIPPSGVFVSLHTQGEMRFGFPKVYEIRYQEGSDGGPL